MAATAATGPMTLGLLIDKQENNFNLIRLLAACAVIYGHSYALNPAGGADIVMQYLQYKFIGGVAVDVFFVISGFLITASMLRSGSVARYLWARFLRIYPGLILCTALITFGLGLALTTKSIWAYLRDYQVREYLFLNATAYDTRYFLPGVFDHLKDKAVNGSLWSLAVEVRCYLVVAAFYLLGLLRREIFNLIFVMLLTIGFFAPQAIPVFSKYDNWLHCSAFFLIGAFFWLNRDSIPIHFPLFVLLLFFGAAMHGTSKVNVGYYVVLSYGVFVLAFVPHLGWFNRLGDYSYGVYLYGWPVQQLCMYVRPNMSPLGNTAWSLAIAIGLGALSWHYFEKPMLSFKRKSRLKAPLVEPLIRVA